MNKYILFIIILFTLMQLPSFAQNELDEKVRTQILNNTDTLSLKSLKEKLIQKNKIDNEKINNLIQTNPNLLIRSSENGKTIELKEIKNGRPVYRTTFNRVAAQTTSTDDVWGSPFNLDGSGIYIGLWDAGAVDEFHTSFREGTYGQKHVFFVDSTGSTVDNHSTHVAGTLVADNDYFNAKGMASKSIVISRDWNADVIEMTNAAALLDPNFPNGILLSNHSYGKLTGWAWADLRKVGTKAWYWMAGNMDSEDPDFGNYNEVSFDYDEIAFNAPNYTIVWAAGNDRGEGPEANAQHYYFNGSQWISTTNYHVVDGGNDGYDCIPPDGVAKNIITVGAIDDIINGYQNSSDVKQINTYFSSWGPTKDGRIKPDIVANGDKLYSTFPNNAIDTMSGTSMAAPNVTGSIALLLQHYKNTHSGYVPLSSTVKAIIIHTADESGTSPGPDYKYGWGLLNTYKAAQLISTDQTKPTTIQEIDLPKESGTQITFNNLYSDGTQPIKITLVWDDLPPVNFTTGPILMRDLDVRLTKDGVTYYPYKLNPASPSAAATTGDNNKDNVEQIYLQSPGAGYYTVVVSHKGTLSTTQKFSLITTGFIEPFVTFYLIQLGNDNQPFGQASYWDNSMWNPVPPTQSVTLSLDKHHFLSIQDFKPMTYEKFNKWDDDVPSTGTGYRNWDTLSLKATTTQVFSRFIPKITGVTIKNSLEGTSVNGGNIKFKDPWLADVTEQPHGLRNQGMSAPFKNQTSPFIPDYTSSYNGDVYKGIFTNQQFNSGTYYSVGSPAEQLITVNGQSRKFYPFSWGGTGITLQNLVSPETGIVFNTSNAVATATLKGQLMSNSTTGISSNSQRKMVRTNNGIYHVVYESMGNLFYTHSLTSNFAGEWAADQYTLDHAKNPAIEYDGNIVKVVCEYYDPTYSSNVDLHLITFTQQPNGSYGFSDDEVFATCPSSYFGNAKPVISYNAAGVALVYRKNSTEGLKLKTKWLLNGTWSWQAESTIPQTDANSINPSIIGETGIIHIAYESLSTIKYKQAYNQGLNWLYNNVITLSTGSGYTGNFEPSISLCDYSNRYVMVSWRGTYTAAVEKRMAKENDYSDHIITAVAKVGYGTSWGGFSSFSNDINFTNNNSLTASYGSVLTWSENGGALSKFVKRNSNGTYGAITSLSHNGIQSLVSNGASFSDMKVMVFNTKTSAPYLLNKCTDNFYQGGGLEKVGETELTGISYGRSGVVEKNNIEFLFNIGDVQVDGQSIKFIERVDTLPVTSIEELNTVARTEQFSLSPQSELIFSNYYYVVNKAMASSLLSDQFNVTFKCELVNSATNIVVGTFDNVTYDKNNVSKYDNPSYLVDCSGIESGNYYLRLFTSVNEDVNLFVSDIQRDDVVLEKSNLLVRNFKGEGIPTVYDLAQNFPNPFNPSTTIRYQIPQDGIVTLKIYDILGSEVATLVNEQKAAGKYEINFNASNFASGVYIYKIQAGSFNSSKKLMLLK